MNHAGLGIIQQVSLTIRSILYKLINSIIKKYDQDKTIKWTTGELSEHGMYCGILLSDAFLSIKGSMSSECPSMCQMTANCTAYMWYHYYGWCLMSTGKPTTSDAWRSSNTNCGIMLAVQ